MRHGAGPYIGAILADHRHRPCHAAAGARRGGCRRLEACAARAARAHSGAGRGGRLRQSRGDPRVRRDHPARTGAARGRAAAAAHPRRRPHAPDDARGNRRSRSSGSRSTISPRPRATCISRCCRTGSMPRPNTRRRTRRCSRRQPHGIARLNQRYAPGDGGRPLPAPASAAGVERRAADSGWDGNASAASSTS